MVNKVKPLAAVAAQTAKCSFTRAPPLAAGVQSDQIKETSEM